MLAVVIAPDGSRVGAGRGGVRLPGGRGGAGDEGAHRRGGRGDPRALEDEAWETRPGRPSEAARRPHRAGDATGRPVRRTRPAAATPWAPPRIVAPTIEIVPIAIRPLTAALRDLSAGRVRVDHAHQPRHGGDTGVAAGLPGDVRAKVAAIGEGTGAAFRAWARRKPDLMPATFTTAGSGARVPARRRARAVCARRHRPSGSRGCAGREGLVARPRRRLPHADGTVAPRRTRGRRCATARSTPSRSPAPRRCAGSSARWAWSGATRRS